MRLATQDAKDAAREAKAEAKEAATEAKREANETAKAARQEAPDNATRMQDFLANMMEMMLGVKTQQKSTSRPSRHEQQKRSPMWQASRKK